LKGDIALPWSTIFHANCADSYASGWSSFGPILIASDVKTFEEVRDSLQISKHEHEVSEWTTSSCIDGLGIDQDENECIHSFSENAFKLSGSKFRMYLN
jgi:hypothetical protein